MADIVGFKKTPRCDTDPDKGITPGPHQVPRSDLPFKTGKSGKPLLFLQKASYHRVSGPDRSQRLPFDQPSGIPEHNRRQEWPADAIDPDSQIRIVKRESYRVHHTVYVYPGILFQYIDRQQFGCGKGDESMTARVV